VKGGALLRRTAWSSRPWWRLKRTYVLASPLLLITVYATLIVGTAIFPLTWKQDACTFGEVSNARYRELLAIAQQSASRDWPTLREAVAPRARSDFPSILQRQVDDLTRGMVSVQERIAAIHAVMRANWAQYEGTYPREGDPFAGVEKTADEQIARQKSLDRGIWAVMFHYRLNMLWFGDAYPSGGQQSGRWAKIDALFYVVGSTRERNNLLIHRDRNTIEIVALIPSFPKGLAYGKSQPAGCPPVPSLAWEKRFLSGEANSSP